MGYQWYRFNRTYVCACLFAASILTQNVLLNNNGIMHNYNRLIKAKKK